MSLTPQPYTSGGTCNQETIYRKHYWLALGPIKTSIHHLIFMAFIIYQHISGRVHCLSALQVSRQWAFLVFTFSRWCRSFKCNSVQSTRDWRRTVALVQMNERNMYGNWHDGMDWWRTDDYFMVIMCVWKKNYALSWFHRILFVFFFFFIYMKIL